MCNGSPSTVPHGQTANTLQRKRFVQLCRIKSFFLLGRFGHAFSQRLHGDQLARLIDGRRRWL